MKRFLALFLFVGLGSPILSWAQAQYETRKEQFDTPRDGREYFDSRSPFRGLSLLPEGEEPRSRGGSSGTDYEEWQLRVHTSSLAGDVLRHYGEQLAEKGWERSSEAVEGSVAFSTWRVRGDDGNPYHALLMASESVHEIGNVTLSVRLTALLGES